MNEKSGIPELTAEQVEKLCEVAEEAARRHILSKVPMRRISDFDITVEVEGLKPLNVIVDVNLELSPLMRNYDTEKLVEEAVQKAFNAVDNYLRELSCKSKE
ncbi:hypothetical protein DRO19_05510 [Candidatus Bathyarchaeota archaeon]|nr:MAG: hypothetical protein DRO19_05510 [Candidatus Bathyarchaeota archaeon]